MANRRFFSIDGEFYDTRYLYRQADRSKEIRSQDSFEVGKEYKFKEPTGEEIYSFTVLEMPVTLDGVVSVKIQKLSEEPSVVPITSLGFHTPIKSQYVESAS